MSDTKTERMRLSIDLDAYPDVKEMLQAAVAATGESTTKIAIKALRMKLTDVVQQRRNEINAGVDDFLTRFDPRQKPTSKDPTTAEIIAAAERAQPSGRAAVPVKPVNSDKKVAKGAYRALRQMAASSEDTAHKDRQ